MDTALDDKIRSQFIDVARAVTAQFPDYDLRFNLQLGESTLRFLAADLSDEVFEIELGDKQTQDIVFDAILKLKEIGQLFDD